ncbi:Membrane-bound lytic murein transglycosylase B precursor [Roseibacterium elongatum DSM 19469]|uniref:Membrane-bound lytic murein transglycosylase B n=1 Tax=Roseicyclus elongatus DSM 19469 TaxID=1294273 RepID=W8S3J2_9RHOB|nr:lytic murein transglycosylase [Roseibacterium elongatum]AHM03331.1 Membrane-bound lytic murein transglycosylase B precursor [Roseibacterium elongatum DSM 19469]
MRGTFFISTLILALWTGLAAAAPPRTSLVPMPRPDAGAVQPVTLVSSAPARAETETRAQPTSLLAVASSMRPSHRGAPPEGFVARTERMAADRMGRVEDPEFRRWIDGFFSRARAQGITTGTLEAAFTGVQLNTRVLERDANQSEFTRALWDYLDSAVSTARVENGRAAYRRYEDELAEIEARYDVDARVIVAIWGLESAYGALRGSDDIIEAMATLAYEGRRQDFFEAQLIAALRILQSGDVRPRDMQGSWAGAMGHTQFMPTSYLEHAQDFDGDGRRNIWSDDPLDALASTAAYLAHFGWERGQPWGVEVRLPDGFDFGLAGERTRRSAAFWRTQGVRLADGGEVPDHGDASILLPAGSQGVALMVFDNFRVIERYNPADAYVIAVGHLGDRIMGGPRFRADWPREDRVLSSDERRELQRRLTAAGFTTYGVDGIIGPNTIEAVRRFQQSIGDVPDGYASSRVLERLRNS